MEIAKYFATLGFKVNKQETKKVDDALADMERKLGGIATNSKTAKKAESERSKGAVKAIKAETDATKNKTDATTKLARANDVVTRSIAKQTTTLKRSADQINRMFPSMKNQPLGAKSADRKMLTSFYGSLFGVADARAAAKAGRLQQEIGAIGRLGAGSGRLRPLGTALAAYKERRLAPEIAALGRIGQNAGGFSPLGRAAGYISRRNAAIGARVSSEVGALGRLGQRSSRFDPMDEPLANRLAAFKSSKSTQEKIEQSEDRIAALRRRTMEAELRHQRRMLEIQQRHSNRIAEIQARAANTGRRSASSVQRGNFLHAGGAAGAFMRYGVESLPFIGGIYGMGMLNRANQELVSTEIAAGAIFGNRANQAKGWLEQHADYVGYNYLETMPIFSSFMASSMPLMGYDTSLGVFQGLAEFGRTRGADGVSMKRAMTAIQQMASKGQVMQEELKLQLSEAKGFGESRAIFADAWQMVTGGNKTGAEAAAQLMDDMRAGKVKSEVLLPVVGEILRALASGGIEQARQSSIASQARSQNEQTRLLRTFSEGGGEQGFSNFWKEVSNLMKGLQPVVKGLAGTFEDLTKVLQAPVYLLSRMSQVLGDLSVVTGISEKNFTNLALIGGLMATKWGRVAAIFTAILVVLEDVAMGVAGQGDSFTGRFIQWLDETGVKLGPFEKALLGVSAALLAIAAGMKAISVASGMAGVDAVLGGGAGRKGGKGGGIIKPGETYIPEGAKGKNPGLLGTLATLSVMYNADLLMKGIIPQRDLLTPEQALGGGALTESQLESQRKARAFWFGPSAQDMQALMGPPPVSGPPAALPGIGRPSFGEVNVNVDVTIEAKTIDDFNYEFQRKFSQVLDETLMQYNNRE